MIGRAQCIFVCGLLLLCSGCLRKVRSSHDIIQKEIDVTVRDGHFSSVFDDNLDEFRSVSDEEPGDCSWGDETAQGAKTDISIS